MLQEWSGKTVTLVSSQALLLLVPQQVSAAAGTRSLTENTSVSTARGTSPRLCRAPTLVPSRPLLRTQTSARSHPPARCPCRRPGRPGASRRRGQGPGRWPDQPPPPSLASRRLHTALHLRADRGNPRLTGTAGRLPTPPTPLQLPAKRRRSLSNRR